MNYHFLVKAILVLALSFSVFSNTTLYAAEPSAEKSKSSKNKKYKTRKAAAMSQKVFKKLQLVQEHIDVKNYLAANEVLTRLLARSKRLSTYEKAQSWNLKAYVFYLQENYPEAIKTYQKVLDQGELPEALTQSTIKTMGQLYFATEQYELALATVKKLIAIVETPTANMHMLLGQAYFQLKQYKQALTPIKKAVSLYRAQKRKPKEQWLQLLRVIYHYENDYDSMRLVLEEMLDLYPKDSHIRALAGVYSELGDINKQLTMMEALYERDYKQSSSQIINLANLYLLQGMPVKAAKMLQQEIVVKKRVKENEQNYRLLSQSWYQAREDEKSIPPLQHAAEISGKGELYVRIAQSFQNLDRWNEAANALRTAIKKGELKRPDSAQLMLGMALFNQHKLELAKKHFELAQKDKRSEKAAGQWIAYTENELHRQQVIDDALSK